MQDDRQSYYEYKDQRDDEISYDGSVISPKEGGNSSFKRHVYFTSNKMNTYIRNASTGVQYPFRVGSNESKHLFKMIDSTGVFDANGKRPYPQKRRSTKDYHSEFSHSLPNPNTNHLYYDTPEECIRHFKEKQRVTLELNPEFVKSWHERNSPMSNTQITTSTADE